MRSVEKHPEAKREIIEAAEFYERRRSGLGDQFLDDVQRALNKIVSNPDTGILYKYGTKLVMLTAFPYGIIYRDQTDYADVFAVVHLSRRPGYWAERLEDK